MSVSNVTKNRIIEGFSRIFFAAIILVLILWAILLIRPVRLDKYGQGSTSVLPVLVVEQTTRRCLVVYEPERKALHACWSERMTPAHRTIEAPAGTKAVDIFNDPDSYLKDN